MNVSEELFRINIKKLLNNELKEKLNGAVIKVVTLEVCEFRIKPSQSISKVNRFCFLEKKKIIQ